MASFSTIPARLMSLRMLWVESLWQFSPHRFTKEIYGLRSEKLPKWRCDTQCYWHKDNASPCVGTVIFSRKSKAITTKGWFLPKKENSGWTRTVWGVSDRWWWDLMVKWSTCSTFDGIFDIDSLKQLMVHPWFYQDVLWFANALLVEGHEKRGSRFCG